MLEKVTDTGDLPAKNNNDADGDSYAVATDAVDFQPQPLGESTAETLFKALVQACLVIAVLVGSFFLTMKMISDKPEPRKRRAFKTVYTVDTVKAEMKDHQPVFTVYGETVAERSVDLRALVSGEIIKVNPNLRGGARVSKGDALVEIDSFNYVGALSEAEANLNEAKARLIEGEAQIGLEKGRLVAAKEQLEFAISDLARALRLKKRGSSTQKEVDSRKLVESQRKQSVLLSKDTIKVLESKVAQTKSSVQRLEWRVEQAKRNLDSAVLVAPFDGVVKSSTAEVGRAITANDVVVSLFEAHALEARFTLTDSQFGRLQESGGNLLGRDVSIVWTVGGHEYSYPGITDRVGAEIASKRGGVEIYAKIGQSDNSVAIRPGAFVEVRVPDQNFKSVVLVPDTAIYETDKVYVAVDGALVKKTVKIAAYDDEQVLISSGLEPGDQVLTTRITEVSEGLRVRTENDAEPQTNAPSAVPNDAAKPSAKTGRPSKEEVAEIIKHNGLTREEFQALSQSEKQKLVAAHRAQAGQ